MSQYVVILAKFFLLVGNSLFLLFHLTNHHNSKQCTRHCSKPFIHINYFDPYNYPVS